MASTVPFYRGQNVTLRLYQSGKPITLVTKNFDYSEEAAEVADPVNGEIRDRLDKVTNYYSGSCDIFQSDQATMTAYMQAQDANDAQGIPLQQSAAIIINHRDGTRAAYSMQGAVFGPMKQSSGSRTDASMMNLKFRFQYLKAIPTL